MIEFLRHVGGWSFFYFILDIFVMLLIVQFVISWTEKKNWKRFRQNYAKNLLERTHALVRSYESGLEKFEPFRSKVSSKKTPAERTQYKLATGTALRNFGVDVRAHRNEIRQSMELGFFAINADLSETVSNYRDILENVVDLTSLLVKADSKADLPPLTQHENKRLLDLKEEVYGLEKIPNKMTGMYETLQSPFCKLNLYLLNFSFSVKCAHPRNRVEMVRNLIRRGRRKVLPFIKKTVLSDKREEVLFGDSRVKHSRGSLKSLTLFSEQCSEVDELLRLALLHTNNQ